MTITHVGGAPVHLDISALIPWYVNGSIGERDRQRVDEHMALCVHCRDELARDRWIHDRMTGENAVEYIPVASLNRLQSRLDDVHSGPAEPPMTDTAPAAERPRHESMPWQGLMAASIAVMAVALSLLAADRWLQFGAHGAAPAYHTVTSAAPRVPDEAIRAVFSPTITLIELQGILDEAKLRIVSGPTEAGVYSLAVKSRQSVSSSLALLRSHAQVRFAEGTQTSVGSGGSP
jgi:hypothetical protein